MWKCSSCDEVLANEHDTCSNCGTINIRDGGSADSDQESQSGSVVRSQKFRFSIRGMIIALAVIAVGAAGYQLWVQSTTEYEIEGTISLAKEDFSRIKNNNAASLAKRFNYIDPDSANTRYPVNSDESIEWVLRYNIKSECNTITYKITANYHNRADKITDLATQLKEIEMREINSDLHFHKIWIEEGPMFNKKKVIKEIPLDKAE